jgi:hypothetical protein
MVFAGFAAALVAGTARAQVTPAQGYEPIDDTPSVKVGGTIFADYTYQDKPTGTDVDNNKIHQNSFNVSRAYINVNANISHLLAARITPDIVRESDGSGTNTSVNGSYVFRLKYAYGQVNFDEWTGKGSWMRLGLQTTPWVDYEEGIYRYRFQGPTFVDREGFLTSSDNALSLHYNLPSNYGDFHVGVYNGEGYSKAEANDQKAIQARFSLRPAPGVPVLKGLRVSAFYDADNYARDDKKRRFVANVTFEHTYINAGFDYLDAKDQANAAASEVHAQGWSAWATPRTTIGLEGLLRYDSLKPNKDNGAKKKRTIVGVAYWFPVTKGVSTALLADYEQVKYDSALNKPKEQRYALHALFNF